MIGFYLKKKKPKKGSFCKIQFSVFIEHLLFYLHNFVVILSFSYIEIKLYLYSTHCLFFTFTGESYYNSPYCPGYCSIDIR